MFSAIGQVMSQRAAYRHALRWRAHHAKEAGRMDIHDSTIAEIRRMDAIDGAFPELVVYGVIAWGLIYVLDPTR